MKWNLTEEGRLNAVLDFLGEFQNREVENPYDEFARELLGDSTDWLWIVPSFKGIL